MPPTSLLDSAHGDSLNDRTRGRVVVVGEIDQRPLGVGGDEIGDGDVRHARTLRARAREAGFAGAKNVASPWGALDALQEVAVKPEPCGGGTDVVRLRLAIAY